MQPMRQLLRVFLSFVLVFAIASDCSVVTCEPTRGQATRKGNLEVLPYQLGAISSPSLSSTLYPSIKARLVRLAIPFAAGAAPLGLSFLYAATFTTSRYLLSLTIIFGSVYVGEGLVRRLLDMQVERKPWPFTNVSHVLTTVGIYVMMGEVHPWLLDYRKAIHAQGLHYSALDWLPDVTFPVEVWRFGILCMSLISNVSALERIQINPRKVVVHTHLALLAAFVVLKFALPPIAPHALTGFTFDVGDLAAYYGATTLSLSVEYLFWRRAFAASA